MGDDLASGAALTSNTERQRLQQHYWAKSLVTEALPVRKLLYERGDLLRSRYVLGFEERPSSVEVGMSTHHELRTSTR